MEALKNGLCLHLEAVASLYEFRGDPTSRPWPGTLRIVANRLSRIPDDHPKLRRLVELAEILQERDPEAETFVDEVCIQIARYRVRTLKHDPAEEFLDQLIKRLETSL
jgi:hypothetical protein